MGRKKRTKSEASPDSVSATQDKRQALHSLSSKMSEHSQSMSSPQSQSILPQYPRVPPYPGPSLHGQYYTPPHNPYMPHFTQMPASPKPVTSSDNFQQFVIDKLEAMDSRLKKLDSIDNQLSSLTQKLTAMDNRVSSVECNITDNNRRLIDREVSRAHDSQTCDEVRAKQTKIDKSIKEEQTRSTQINLEINSLKSVNKKLSDDIIDLQSRSMRDNLLFFNFDECHSPTDRYDEDCASKILDFSESNLNIPDARQSIKIDRAHRIGPYDNSKKRPIVVKFNYFQDKAMVKKCAFSVLKDSQFRVSDQFPKAIQDRRKALIPHLIKAKENNKKAVLSYDKLYIDGRLFRGEATRDSS